MAKELHASAGAEVHLTAENVIPGTPLYMAPERFYDDERADHRSDLYSLADVAYFLISGRAVFPADRPAHAIVQHVRSRPEALRERGVAVSAELQSVLLKNVF